MGKYDYETISPTGSKYSFKETNSHVIVYVNDKEWGVPQGCHFIKALLHDIKELKHKEEASSN